MGDDSTTAADGEWRDWAGVTADDLANPAFVVLGAADADDGPPTRAFEDPAVPRRCVDTARCCVGRG